MPRSDSDEGHSEASIRERQSKRVAQARGSGTGLKRRSNASRVVAENLTTQLTAIKDSMAVAVQDTSELKEVRKQTLKLDQFAVTRDAVGLLEDAAAFELASREEQRFLINHLRKDDNALNFLSCGRTLRDEWIEDAIKEMHKAVKQRQANDDDRDSLNIMQECTGC